jgi:hypothetical protein
MGSFNQKGKGVWQKLGPYQVVSQGGSITVEFRNGNAGMSGLEIWKIQQ